MAQPSVYVELYGVSRGFCPWQKHKPLACCKKYGNMVTKYVVSPVRDDHIYSPAWPSARSSSRLFGTRTTRKVDARCVWWGSPTSVACRVLRFWIWPRPWDRRIVVARRHLVQRYTDTAGGAGWPAAQTPLPSPNSTAKNMNPSSPPKKKCAG